jgi:hypothetical protein
MQHTLITNVCSSRHSVQNGIFQTLDITKSQVDSQSGERMYSVDCIPNKSYPGGNVVRTMEKSQGKAPSGVRNDFGYSRWEKSWRRSIYGNV